MPNNLIKAKLLIPPLRSMWVQRPDLIRQLNEGLSQKLILVSASAGYGKSTLLDAWAHQLTVPVAWLSLESADNSPTRFWAYFIPALQTIPGFHENRVGEGLLDLENITASSQEESLTQLFDEFAQAPSHFVLILDDLHLITNSVIHSGLVFILEHLPQPPGGMSLVVASRMDPPWPLARMRGRAEITELRTGDLRFNSREATDFLNRVMGLQLSANDVSVLDQRTEGWIAGLQMAALSMQKQKDIPAFLERFAGSHRYILDYLIEEVLNQQSPKTLDFLLKTSILDKLTAPLCDAVTGETGSQEILIQLERSNVFLSSLDDEQCWYRYHHLFAELLLKRLEQTQHEQVVVLHKRAAMFYESEGLITETVSHALAGKDYESLIKLVETNAYTIIPSDILRVGEQLRSLPDETIRSQPWVLIALAWAYVETGNLPAVEPCLKRAEESLAEFPFASDAERKRMIGHISLIRGYNLSLYDNMPKAIEKLKYALDILPAKDTATRSLAATALSTALRWSGQLTEGYRYGEEAIAMARVSGSVNALVDVLGDFAILLTLQGKLNRAAETCREAIRIAEKSRKPASQIAPVVGPIYAFYSAVLREVNEIHPALKYAQEGLLLCQQWGQAPNLFRAYCDLAKAFQVTGDNDKAEHATREAEKTAGSISKWYENRAATLRLWRNVMIGNISAAAQWIRTSRLDSKNQITFEYCEQYCLIAKVFLAEGKRKEALALLRKLLKIAESAGALGYTAEVLALQALAIAEISDNGRIKGKLDAAMACLKRSLALAEPEGYVRIYADVGEPMEVLLRRAIRKGIHKEYAQKILDIIEAETKTRGKETKSQAGTLASGEELPEPLSEKELEVLRLLNSKLSVPEIAQELTLAPSTVRSHVRVIYSKLGVHGRLEAIQKARELKLV